MRFVPEMSRFGLEVFQGKLHDDNGYVDLLNTFDTPTGDRPGYASISLIRQAAARIPQIGLVPRDALELAAQRADDTEALLAEANAQIERLEAQLERINGIVKDGPFKIVRQQGRPPVNRKVAA